MSTTPTITYAYAPVPSVPLATNIQQPQQATYILQQGPIENGTQFPQTVILADGQQALLNPSSVLMEDASGHLIPAEMLGASDSLVALGGGQQYFQTIEASENGDGGLNQYVIVSEDFVNPQEEGMQEVDAGMTTVTLKDDDVGQPIQFVQFDPSTMGGTMTVPNVVQGNALVTTAIVLPTPLEQPRKTVCFTSKPAFHVDGNWFRQTQASSESIIENAYSSAFQGTKKDAIAPTMSSPTGNGLNTTGAGGQEASLSQDLLGDSEGSPIVLNASSSSPQTAMKRSSIIAGQQQGGKVIRLLSMGKTPDAELMESTGMKNPKTRQIIVSRKQIESGFGRGNQIIFTQSPGAASVIKSVSSVAPALSNPPSSSAVRSVITKVGDPSVPNPAAEKGETSQTKKALNFVKMNVAPTSVISVNKNKPGQQAPSTPGQRGTLDDKSGQFVSRHIAPPVQRLSAGPAVPPVQKVSAGPTPPPVQKLSAGSQKVPKPTLPPVQTTSSLHLAKSKSVTDKKSQSVKPAPKGKSVEKMEVQRANKSGSTSGATSAATCSLSSAPSSNRAQGRGGAAGAPPKPSSKIGGGKKPSDDESEEERELELRNPAESPVRMCIRRGCKNAAIEDPEWKDEYCSNECAVAYTGDVFEEWVKSRQIKENASP